MDQISQESTSRLGGNSIVVSKYMFMHTTTQVLRQQHRGHDKLVSGGWVAVITPIPIEIVMLGH